MKALQRWPIWIVLLAVLATFSLACSLTPFFTAFNNSPAAPTAEAVLPTVPPPASGNGAAEPTSPPSVTAPATGNLSTFETTLVDLYRQVSPGVVAIRVYLPDGGAQGSGFVYDKEGHVVTNFHVVDGAEKVEVDFLSGRKAWARIVGTDKDSDLAVLQVQDVPAEELHPLPLADSDKVQVGQIVVALGNPFGLKGTMTMGIVSALGRTLPSEHEAAQGGYFTAGDMIQTDAPINPGNSGGPLLNMEGQVIGINRAIRTTSSFVGEPVNSGIGFAIPSNIVRRVVPALIKQGYYDYPYLGISSVDDLTLEEVEELNLPQQTGAYVVSVVPGSPADKAGLKGAVPLDERENYQTLPPGGDLIIAVDGHPVREFNDLLHYLFTYTSPGDTITLTVLRDGKKLDLQLTLGKRPH
ncbi:MAG: PDZ domain-containing protein [Chloroflexi bacterium]|nr:PDZ domain-containing protein [Chloroflexota bacterium]